MSVISLLSLLLQFPWLFTQLKTFGYFPFPPFNIILLLTQNTLMFKMANSIQTPKIPEWCSVHYRFSPLSCQHIVCYTPFLNSNCHHYIQIFTLVWYLKIPTFIHSTTCTEWGPNSEANSCSSDRDTLYILWGSVYSRISKRQFLVSVLSQTKLYHTTPNYYLIFQDSEKHCLTNIQVSQVITFFQTSPPNHSSVSSMQRVAPISTSQTWSP